MTTLLVSLFVKDKDNVENSKVREQYGVLTSVVGIFCNFILFLTKFTIGMMINSISVMADAFNNLSDAASSIISFIGVKLSSRPADKEHPFGHGRSEYLSALIVAFLVIQVGFSCFKSSFDKILHPESVQFNIILLVILCLSVTVKVWLGLFNRKLGNRINSSVMKATSADAFGDVIITSATILSVIIGKLSGLKIDGYMGFIVSILVIYAGFNIAKETIEPLIGEAVSPELYRKITNIVESYDGIVGSHDLIVHNYGPTNSMATIHAEVPNTVDIEDAHETIDRIEREILREHNIFLVIHMDPIEVKDENVLKYKEMTKEIINKYDEEASLHDFRVVRGDKRINLIFDLVVPFSYKEEDNENIIEYVTNGVTQIDDRLKLVITVEKSFIAKA
ncbi:cation diffusion facilitator family transporter [Anaeromicropila herbilytica]|uniref:Cation diffusion facilitator transporter n=1 Tax=Anaeromicropila herbilytica TaxID=2785025 RepID=A0A7R7ICB1_9FIRM|nr:cation diffusion facilitator family transporter [Anaeromicropila herbilytica]BCN29734.1 cation diffusion facilitator transporter [Anaeromicropila herbilytica]